MTRQQSPQEPAGVERGTYHAASPAPDVRARTRGTTPAELRAEARTIRSAGNRSAHAARQAATELRRAARRLELDDPHREQLLALAEHNDAQAAAWEAQRPAVPTIGERRQAGRAPRTLTAVQRAELEAAGIDVDRMLEAAAYARTSATSRRRRR